MQTTATSGADGGIWRALGGTDFLIMRRDPLQSGRIPGPPYGIRDTVGSQLARVGKGTDAPAPRDRNGAGGPRGGSHSSGPGGRNEYGAPGMPLVSTMAGAALFALVLAINLLGDGLRDVAAPRRAR